MTISHRKRKAAGDQSGIQYHCDACKRDISTTVRVRCGECADFDLCVDCFRGGAEPSGSTHQRGHPYRLLDRHAMPLLDLGWGADEEWLLIEGIDTYGLGNWADIAAHVGTKTLDECRDHYVRHYVDTPLFPLPPLAQHRFDPIQVLEARKKRQLSPHKHSRNLLPPMKPKVQPSVPANHEIQGYMPKRLEFDLEHENDAELSVKDMLFSEEDTAADVELKLAVLDIYNQRLDRRAERKKFAFERGFIEFKKTQLLDRKRSKEEKDVMAKTKCFAPLMTPADYNTFVNGLTLEQQLRDRIALLQHYRRNGIRSFKEAEEYTAQKRARMNTIYAKSPFVGTSDRVIAKMNKAQASNSRDGTPLPHATTTSAAPPPLTSLKSVSRISAGSSSIDISAQDGYDQLSPAEQQLCTQLRLLPRPYMVVKQTLMRQCELRGGLKRNHARKLVRIDVNKMTKIMDFFYERGWLRPPPA